MPIFESVILSVTLPALKALGIWRFLQRRNKNKLCETMATLARDYSEVAKQTQEAYATLIVLYRYPIVRETNGITVNVNKIYDLGLLRKLHNKCVDAFTLEQNRLIESIFDTCLDINKNVDKISLKEETIEYQKNIGRQLLIDWCFVIFTLEKIGQNRSEFKPINRDPKDLNENIRKRYGVVLDENELFRLGLSKFGLKLVTIE